MEVPNHGILYLVGSEEDFLRRFCVLIDPLDAFGKMF